MGTIGRCAWSITRGCCEPGLMMRLARRFQNTSLFKQTGTPKPTFTNLPLRETAAAALRRTPELAAFGYVIELADTTTANVVERGHRTSSRTGDISR